jgi:hypothetical protein
MSFVNPQYDPVFLTKVHELFRTCWAVVEVCRPDLDSESQSSLRRSLASRLLREAEGPDDDSIVDRVLIDILPKMYV